MEKSQKGQHVCIPRKGGIDNRSLNVLLPNKIELNPTKKTIQDLKKIASYDYLLNIKCSSDRNDINSNLQIGPNYAYKQNKVSIIVEVYDLNEALIIFQQKVTGTLEVEKNNQDLAFLQTLNNMMISGLKKIMKKNEISKQVL